MVDEAGLSYGWAGLVNDFLGIPMQEWLGQLNQYHERALHEHASGSQIIAWENSYSALATELAAITQYNPSVDEWSIIFEYELPRERGRRPDAIILGPGVLYVLEFKDYSNILQAHIDQTAAYARDLQHYHAATRELKVRPILILTKAKDLIKEIDNVLIISPDHLSTAISNISPQENTSLVDSSTWLQADYAPLPSLISAARMIFSHHSLPKLERADSAGISQAIEELNKIAERAQAKNERHIAFVTGVPGAGKTLVGIQFVYENSLIHNQESKNAVFLSGNGPLVQVLQHALQNRIFVQDVHGFLKQYGGARSNLPIEHIWVYDEAQRAWDAQRVHEKRGHPTSEPEDFLKIGERMDSWAFMLALIGEGQEIHLGEEAGIEQWNDAIAAMPSSWTVHCPSKISHLFNAASEIFESDDLDLNVTLRSHLAEDVSTWIAALLTGDIKQARNLAELVATQGFDMYLTRNFDLAKQYVQDRYLGEIDKRYGILASSKAKNLPKFGIHNEFNYTQKLKVGPWYNDPPTSAYSCCALHDVATEFSCQGLELDFPIICWGSDFTWNEGVWNTPRVTVRTKAKDPHRLRTNSYRVLLSRGRDGFIIYIPDEDRMDSTAAILQEAGVVELRPIVVKMGNGQSVGLA